MRNTTQRNTIVQCPVSITRIGVRIPCQTLQLDATMVIQIFEHVQCIYKVPVLDNVVGIWCRSSSQSNNGKSNVIPLCATSTTQGDSSNVGNPVSLSSESGSLYLVVLFITSMIHCSNLYQTSSKDGLCWISSFVIPRSITILASTCIVVAKLSQLILESLWAWTAASSTTRSFDGRWVCSSGLQIHHKYYHLFPVFHLIGFG